MRQPVHVVITDSGLGGLAICAALERGLRRAGVSDGVRLTYVNAWPYEGRGYNDLPGVAARARVFDAALSSMAAMRPDVLVVACNTLSILYPHTGFSRDPAVPVRGIVDAGVGLFEERLREDPSSSIVLTGTRTTIESGAHRDGLVAAGVDPGRIAAVSCHGLAAAIERDVDGPGAAALIGACAGRAARAAAPGATLYLGLCCTHYGYVAGRLAEALAAESGRPVRTLDPNLRLVDRLLADDAFVPRVRPGAPDAEAARPGEPERPIAIELISKVKLDAAARTSIARLVEPISPATAAALLSYRRVPDLF
jgi:glutamate racemase